MKDKLCLAYYLINVGNSVDNTECDVYSISCFLLLI